MAKIAGVQEVSRADLRPYERNAKKHSADQVDKIARSIQEFGFLSPCLIDRDMNIIAGHGRVMAAEQLGMETVPCVFVEGLTEEQRRAYILADNRLTELGGWDDELVQEELAALSEVGFDIELTGFEFDIDGETTSAKTEEINPVLTLPDSRVLVCSISAFGTTSEKFIEIQLSQDEADHLLQRANELDTSEIAEKFRRAIDEI